MYKARELGTNKTCAQLSGATGTNTSTNTKLVALVAQKPATAKVEQKAVEPVNAARLVVVQGSSQGAPAQEQASQPLLPLPSAKQMQQGTAQVSIMVFTCAVGAPSAKGGLYEGDGALYRLTLMECEMLDL